MTENRWILPAGIQEALPPEAERLEALRRALIDLYHSWGYQLVMPPLIEYLESLLTGVGHELDLRTFKLTDQLTGRMMGVRSDLTPQVARIDAHHLRDEGPTRLCYCGTVLHTRPEGFSGTRSPLQVGVELYGHKGVDSDAEVLALMIQTLRLTGVENLHIDLGHVGIYRGLARQAGLSEAQETQLFDVLQRKAATETQTFLSEADMSDDCRRMLSELAGLSGDRAVLSQAREVLAAADADVHTALDELEAIADRAAGLGADAPLYFDLAELRGYHYHTGAVFAAFIPGHGEDVARGGRYDDVGACFGRARPATGFSTDLKTLALLGNSVAAKGGVIYAPRDDDPALAQKIAALRAAGECVAAGLEGESAMAAGCDRKLEKQGNDWTVVDL